MTHLVVVQLLPLVSLVMLLPLASLVQLLLPASLVQLLFLFAMAFVGPQGSLVLERHEALRTFICPDSLVCPLVFGDLG